MPSFEGPFSQYLSPSQSPYVGQANIPVPGAKIPRTAAAAAIIDKFLEGVSRGRERSFALQQQQQQQQVGVLTNKLNQILNDPTRTEADRQAASQPIYRALGQIMGGAIDQGQGQQKKGKKGQGGGEESQQPQGIGHHLVGVMKDFATGLAGGKFPKELDPQTVKNLVGGALVDADTMLAKTPTVEALTNQFQAGMAKAAQGVQGKTWDQAAPAFDPYRSLAMKIDPSGKLWQQTSQDLQTRFGNAPVPGSKEYWATHPEQVIANAEKIKGSPLTEQEKAELALSTFGIKPNQSITYGPTQPGSALVDKYPVTVDNKPTQAGGHYKIKKEGGVEVGVVEVEGPRPTKEGELQQRANELYLDQHKYLSPSKPLSPTQEAEAKRDYNTFLARRSADNPIFDIQAWDFLTKGTFDAGGFGAAASQTRQDIVNRAQQIMDENHLGPGDVMAMRAGFKADYAALARVTTQGAVVTQLEDQLSRNMDIARQLDEKYKRGDVQFMNRIQAAFSTGTGDSEALNLAAQLHAVSREWAKLMQGQTSAAGVSISEAKDTDSLISNAMSSGQLKSLFDNVVTRDADTRSKAIQHTRETLLDSIRGIVPQASARSSPGATSAALANNPLGIKQGGSFVTYATPQQGFQAGLKDIMGKISGATSTGVSGKSSLTSFVNIWTTGDASGTGAGYSAKDVVGYLKDKGVKVDESTPINQIPAGQLAAAVAHFETGYDATEQDLKQAAMAERATKTLGGNPFRRSGGSTNAPAPQPGAPANNRLGLPISQ